MNPSLFLKTRKRIARAANRPLWSKYFEMQGIKSVKVYPDAPKWPTDLWADRYMQSGKYYDYLVKMGQIEPTKPLTIELVNELTKNLTFDDEPSIPRRLSREGIQRRKTPQLVADKSTEPGEPV